ncbi:glycoside hydrolase family 26 protein [Flavobacterium chungangense]|uniref:Beta-mannosidase n=1 Tax=Flavobacterium chungangense TaxID=554283 RepID=A0A6V6YX03_9FLAO|nr:glycosyl hydrolase [Flavobacterium chungangense]CAD0003965.1 beta-mannosidase [Flavobacterium chungangense]
MKNYIRIFFLSAPILFFAGCSSDDVTNNPVIVDPPVVVATDPLTNSNTTTYMVDANATKETVALFYNLKKLAKSKFAIGQQDAFISFYKNSSGESDIKKITGNDPAIIGSDLSFVTDIRNDGTTSNWFYQQEVKNITQIKNAYAKGIINTVSWHLRGPKNKNYSETDKEEYTFYANSMFEADKSIFFRSILPGGTRHEWFKEKLDQVAAFSSKLKGTKGELIPIIFRPFHEFDGSWFWWGADFCTPEEYKTVYKFTVDYLKNTKGVHNILYAFSPDRTYLTSTDYLSRYPGDKYVDVLGMDNYGDFDNQGTTGANTANSKLKIISDLAKTKVKIAALTETGYRVTSSKTPINDWFSNYLYSALTSNSIEVSYVMFWNNDENGYYVPNGSVSNDADFKTFSLKSKSALLNSLPKMYELPK